jgi:hypothetical protein
MVKKQWAIKNDIIKTIRRVKAWGLMSDNVYIWRIGTEIAKVMAETNIRDKIKIKSPTELIAATLNEFSTIILFKKNLLIKTKI